MSDGHRCYPCGLSIEPSYRGATAPHAPQPRDELAPAIAIPAAWRIGHVLLAGWVGDPSVKVADLRATDRLSVGRRSATSAGAFGDPSEGGL